MKLNVRRISCAMPLAVLASACTVMPDFEAANCRGVEYVRANIEQLAGSEVSVCGYLKYEVEDMSLYQAPRAAKQYSESQCLSIWERRGITMELPALNNRWVHITGSATADFFPEGTICQASCSEVGVFVNAATASK